MQELMIVEGNPRKRRKTRKRRAAASCPRGRTTKRYRRRSSPKRYRRRRLNPRGGMSLMGVNVVHVAGGAAVATGASLLRNFIGPKIGVADKGVMGYAMQIATGYLAKMLVGNVLGQRAIANKGFEYTLANVVERAVRENVLPMTGIGRFLGQAYTGATPTPSAGGRVRSRFVNSSRALNTAVRPTVDMTTPIDRFAPRY